jgi:uridine phosphorylase
MEMSPDMIDPFTKKTQVFTTSRSASSPWLGDRPPHLPCRRGELPSAVFFPGDPGRVDRFGAVLEHFTILGQNREFRIGKGIFQGMELGVCSTGIGGPSTEIALVEAAELGCTVALRVGGAGALDSDIPLGSMLLVEEALRGGGAAAFYAQPDQPATAHPDVLRALAERLEASGTEYRRCKVASVDGYYAGQGRPYPHSSAESISLLESYRRQGVSALDMEAETILIVGKALGLKSGVLLAVHGNRGNNTWLEPYEDTQDRLIRVACEAMLQIHG